MAIVWACPLDVDAYAAAGRAVVVPRPRCPACGRAMVFWSGYERDVRLGAVRRVWVRRARCRPCARSHALVPAFCLLGRLDGVEVIGPALARAVAGVGMRVAAAAAGVAHTTARDWRRRFRARALGIASALTALAVGLHGTAPALPADPERAALEALGAAWAAAERRLGDRAPPLWCFASLVSGGAWLASTTNPPWAPGLGARLMPPAP